MPSPDLHALGRQLLQAGVAPRHVARAMIELREHVEDIEAELIARGASAESAASEACGRIGAIEMLRDRYLDRPELRRWSHRHPLLARSIASVEHALPLPVVPVSAMTAAAPAIARWAACLLISAGVTLGLLLAMQLTISLA